MSLSAPGSGGSRVGPAKSVILFLLLLLVSAAIGFQVNSVYYNTVEVRTIYVCSDDSEVSDKTLCPTTTLLPTTTTSSSTSITSTSSTVSTTVEALDCVQLPGANCTCLRWRCPSSTTTSTTTTTTTCVTIPNRNYTPQTRTVGVVLSEQKFTPGEIEAFVGDRLVIMINNRKGLYKIRDPLSGAAVVLKPGEVSTLHFNAVSEGVYTVSCAEFCADPKEFRIRVVEPYTKVC